MSIDNDVIRRRGRQLKGLFESSHVQRWHTMPHHTDSSLARHQWGVATVIMFFHPMASAQLLWAALSHDFPERWSGDIPSPSRKQWPVLQEGENQSQDDVWLHMGLPNPVDRLTAEEKWWLGMADIVEAYLWTVHEFALGNQYVRRSNSALMESMLKMVDSPDAPAGAKTIIQILAATNLSNRHPDRLSEVEI